MNTLSHKILDSYQVRMRKRQKNAFIELLKTELPYEMRIEKTYFGGQNIIFGDPDKAKYILTAHYDTAPVLPFPNFIAPRNMLAYLGYMLVLMAGLLLIIGLAEWLVFLIFGENAIQMLAYFSILAFCFLWMFIGKPNKHTANDNTSGVITLLEALQDETIRENCCIVLFDLEEMGLYGSAGFSGKHKNLKKKPVINFDCVGDGNHIMFVIPKKEKELKEKLQAAFRPLDNKQVIFCNASTTFYPSDQSNFKRGIGVAAFKKKKLLGYYMNRIHTAKDTVCEAKNIELLVDGLKRLVQE